MSWDATPQMPWEAPSQHDDMQMNQPLQPSHVQMPWGTMPQTQALPWGLLPFAHVPFDLDGSAPDDVSWPMPGDQLAHDNQQFPAQPCSCGYTVAHFGDTRPEWSSLDVGHHSVTNPYRPRYGEVGLESMPAEPEPLLLLLNSSVQFPPEASHQYTTNSISPGYAETCVEDTEPEKLTSDEGDEGAAQPSTQSSPDLVGASLTNRQKKRAYLRNGTKSAVQLFFENGRPESAEKGWPYAVMDENRPLLVVYYPEDDEEDSDDENEYNLDWEELHRSPTWSRNAGARILISPKAQDVNINPYNALWRRYQRWINFPEEGHPNPAKILAVAGNPKQNGCSVSYHDALCCLLVSRTDDHIIFRNRSNRTFSCTQLGKGGMYAVPPSGETSLHVGLWALAVDGETLLELEVLERIPFLIAEPSVSKRAAPTEEGQSKKRRELDEQATHNELSELQPGQIIRVDGTYRLKLLKTMRDHADSCSWLGEYSDALGTKFVAVEVIKTKGNSPAEAADSFQRAVSIHSALNEHVSANYHKDPIKLDANTRPKAGYSETSWRRHSLQYLTL